MNTRINLNGTWRLRWTDHERGGDIKRLTGPEADLRQALPAAVPGEVHLDLMRAGLADEPGVGLNCLHQRWVEEFLWNYRRTFQAPALSAGQRAFLVFKTLDLAATVFLNGVQVGTHANAFYPLTIDVTAQLKPGENVLAVQLDSGLWHAADKPARGWTNPRAWLHKRHWLRQTQSTFGWDWSERLLNVGIRGDVYLEVCSAVRVEAFVPLAELAADLKTGSLTGRLIVEGLDGQERPAKLTVELAGEKGVRPLFQTSQFTVKQGINRLEVKLPVDAPELWRPVGHGAQPLYEARYKLEIDGQVVTEGAKQVGFRHVRVCQDPHPQQGRYFYLEVNGKPIFCKGGNFVPADLIMARLDRARYEALVARALEANFNILRVWGGGLYESDDFYELCDRRGVLVWQEFIFACARYPGMDEAFHKDVMAEAAYQVRRLANHPSLVVWCGNNENETLYCKPDPVPGFVSLPDYGLYHLVLPTVLGREDGTRFYWPSSPYSPDGQPPQDPHVGDQHPWSLGFVDMDFRKYRQMTCRFPNEGGFLGPTALPTIRACLEPGMDKPGSFAWEIHDNSVMYWRTEGYPDLMLQQWLGRDIADMNLADYAYWAGVVQGEAFTEYVKNFRRRMFDSAAAIFWMYNDAWPMVRSWTIIDYYLRRTPAFHPVRRAMAERTVVVTIEGGKVLVFGVNDGPAWQGQLRYGLFALAGGMTMDKTIAVELKANASVLLAEFAGADLERLAATHGAFAILSAPAAGGQPTQEVARDRLLLPLFKEMTWPQAKVHIRRAGGQAIFESDTFAWRVCLDLDGEQPYPDNFFDILPGIPTVLDWPAELGEPVIIRLGNG